MILDRLEPGSISDCYRRYPAIAFTRPQVCLRWNLLSLLLQVLLIIDKSRVLKPPVVYKVGLELQVKKSSTSLFCVSMTTLEEWKEPKHIIRKCTRVNYAKYCLKQSFWATKINIVNFLHNAGSFNHTILKSSPPSCLESFFL